MYQIFKKLLSFYNEREMNSESDYEKILRKNAEIFLQNFSDDQKIIILNLEEEFIEKEVEKMNIQNPEVRFEMLLGLQNFLIAIKNTIDGYQPKFLNWQGLRRQICPPIEVFNYVGHSELKISESEIGYALLFE